MGAARSLCAALAVSAAFAACAAHAQVIEIADDGSFTTYSAPMVYTGLGAAQPIVVARAAPNAGLGVKAAIAAAAAQYALSPRLLEAVAWQESRFRHDARSQKGAVGVMQLMPATARDLRVDPFDMAQNVSGGAAYLSQMLRRYEGDVARGLAAYNAGPGAVDRYGGVPPYAETRAYVRSIMGRVAAATP